MVFAVPRSYWRFWTVMSGSTFHHHHRTTNWENKFWTWCISLKLRMTVPETCRNLCRKEGENYLPEVRNSWGQRTLSGNVSWISGVMIHLKEKHIKQLYNTYCNGSTVTVSTVRNTVSGFLKYVLTIGLALMYSELPWLFSTFRQILEWSSETSV